MIEEDRGDERTPVRKVRLAHEYMSGRLLVTYAFAESDKISLACAERLVELTKVEIDVLETCGVQVARPVIRLSLDHEDVVVTTETPRVDGVELPLVDHAEFASNPAMLNAARSLVDSLANYLDSRIGAEAPLMDDIFRIEQYMLRRDGSLVLVDTEGILTTDDSGFRHGHEARSIMRLYNLAHDMGLFADQGFARDTLIRLRELAGRLPAPEVGGSSASVMALLFSEAVEAGRRIDEGVGDDILTAYSRFDSDELSAMDQFSS
jgi:hypothetical protein